MGGARPLPGAVVLDLTEMRRIRSIDVVSKSVTAEAGIVLGELARRLRARRLLLGHDPWSQPRATLGGAIGTNGVGYTAFVHGSMGDQVLGLEAVLADGSVLRTRAVPRSTTGFDLKRLFIGTEGTLGVVTCATVCVFPLPEREDVRAFAFSDFHPAFEAITALFDDGLRPFVMDLEESFRAPASPWGTESEPPVLFLGFGGNSEIVRTSWRVASARLRRSGAKVLAKRDARAFWRGRHEIIYRTDEVRPGVTRADLFLKDVIFDYLHVALPRSEVLAFHRAAPAILRRRGVTPTGFGLWTQPELVSVEMIRPVGKDRGADKAVVAAACAEVLRKTMALGGSIEYVHGIGIQLAHFMNEELGAGLEVQRRVKKALDPRGILNPGKEAL
jgi:FAD/FMN-containing dehydrogenase